ncbi:MAG: hypothetical protein IJO20_02600 [Ruminococcus sp.]|nr:hypothetical protein [Ruminococcus sp.]
MSLTLNKVLRAVVSVLLCVCICFAFSACTKNTKNIKGADQICVSGALYESFMYVFTDEVFVDEMVTIFNDAKYEISDTPVDMMTPGECLSFTFSKGNDTLSKFIVDKSGTFCFVAGEQSYKLVTDFDFDYVKGLVDEQIKALNGTEATPDEV